MLDTNNSYSHYPLPNPAQLCICLLGRGITTRIDRQINDTSLSLRGQRSRVLGERLHLDGASVVHFIEVTCWFSCSPTLLRLLR